MSVRVVHTAAAGGDRAALRVHTKTTPGAAIVERTMRASRAEGTSRT